MTQILVLADTHVTTLRELPQSVTDAIRDTEWVVHCGDYTSLAVLQELQHIAKHFVGVYGNSDPPDVRQELPAETIIELEGKRIAVIHPPWGGSPDKLEEKLIARFPGVDAILFGHTHDTCNENINGILMFNPGQSYAFHSMPVSAGIVTVSNRELTGKLVMLG